MIRKIKIENFGPFYGEHGPFLFENGSYLLTGPNEIGKSSFLDAFCFACAGTNRLGQKITSSSIHNDANRTQVTVETPRGTMFGRTLARESSQTRMVQKKGDLSPRIISTEKDFLSELKLPDKDLFLSIVSPFYAIKVLGGKGKGQRLRTLIEGAGKTGGNYEAEFMSYMNKHYPTASDIAGEFKPQTEDEIKDQLRDVRSQIKICDSEISFMESQKYSSVKTLRPSRRRELESATKEAKSELHKLETDYNNMLSMLRGGFTTTLDKKIEDTKSEALLIQMRLDSMRKLGKCVVCSQTMESFDASQVDRDLMEKGNEVSRLLARRGIEKKEWSDKLAVELDSMAKKIRMLRESVRDMEAELKPANVTSIESFKTINESKTKRAGLVKKEALLKAMREAAVYAPGAILQQRESMFRGLGFDVEFSPDPENSGLVSISKDGVPFDFLSHGAQIAIDCQFRMALRLSYNLSWLPVFVDHAESVTFSRLVIPPGQSFFLLYKEAGHKQIVFTDIGRVMSIQLRRFLEKNQEGELSRDIKSLLDSHDKKPNISALRGAWEFVSDGRMAIGDLGS